MTTTSYSRPIDHEKTPSPVGLGANMQEDQLNENKSHPQQDLPEYPPLPRVIMITIALYLAIFLVALVGSLISLSSYYQQY